MYLLDYYLYAVSHSFVLLYALFPHLSQVQLGSKSRVTTCLENLEMSGNLTAVKEMSELLLKLREVSAKKSCQEKMA